jgi:hypothetical protein
MQIGFSGEEFGPCPLCALRAKVARLEAAISWALGEAGSDFRGRRENEGPYWWRKEFRIRARGREGE